MYYLFKFRQGCTMFSDETGPSVVSLIPVRLVYITDPSKTGISELPHAPLAPNGPKATEDPDPPYSPGVT